MRKTMLSTATTEMVKLNFLIYGVGGDGVPFDQLAERPDLRDLIEVMCLVHAIAVDQFEEPVDHVTKVIQFIRTTVLGVLPGFLEDFLPQ